MTEHIFQCPWFHRDDGRCTYTYDGPDEQALADHLVVVHGVSSDFARRTAQAMNIDPDKE